LVETNMRRKRRTADELTALIKDRATALGPWPAKMTMLLYPMNETWEITVSPGKEHRGGRIQNFGALDRDPDAG
jgi:hypothetical protein